MPLSDTDLVSRFQQCSLRKQHQPPNQAHQANLCLSAPVTNHKAFVSSIHTDDIAQISLVPSWCKFTDPVILAAYILIRRALGAKGINRICVLPEVGAMLPISPREAYTAINPSQVARLVYKKPALPPFESPREAVERMPSQELMRITLKPNMVTVPKLRYTYALQLKPSRTSKFLMLLPSSPGACPFEPYREHRQHYSSFHEGFRRFR